MSANNELVKERNRAAAERTLITWIQHCVSLIGFGIAFEEILAAIEQSFNGTNMSLKIQVVKVLSLMFIMSGILLLGSASIQYCLEVKFIENDNYLSLSSNPLNFAVTLAVILFGCLSFLAVFIKLSY